MAKYKAIIFDADHTLLRYTDDEKDAFKRTFSRFKVEYDEKLLKRAEILSEQCWAEAGLYDVESEFTQKNYHTLYKTHLTNFFSRLFLEFPSVFSLVSAEEMKETFLKELETGENRMPNALKTVKSLYESGKYRIYIATNGLTAIQKGRLKDFLPFVHDVFVSEELGVIKPNPLFFEKIGRKIGISLQDCLMVGDSYSSDILGANRVKMDSCYYNTRQETVKNPVFTYEIENLSELLTIL